MFRSKLVGNNKTPVFSFKADEHEYQSNTESVGFGLGNPKQSCKYLLGTHETGRRMYTDKISPRIHGCGNMPRVGYEAMCVLENRLWLVS